jgi:acyl-coenzyme A synthetase/AMP-(fatty) acid ligase
MHGLAASGQDGTRIDDALLWRGATPVTRAALLAEAAAVADLLDAELPRDARIVNLCEQREYFLLASAAALIAGRIQLLPVARSAAALAVLAREYPDSLQLDDEGLRRRRQARAGVCDVRPLVPADADRLVMVPFTSGSTGESQPHPKHWRALAASAQFNATSLRTAIGVPADTPLSLVGTVPAHHMYGLEFTVLLPLFANMSVHGERPLFPADVAAALSQPARPRVLVSTPLHLRALAESGLAFPEMDLIVSATAPLDEDLARRVETRLRAPLLEIFGSTETGVIATRRTSNDECWRLYPGITLQPEVDSTRVSAPWFESAQILQDVLELRGADGFVLRGRNSDLVEVAGKRASLADITRRLCAVPGVEDAVAFQPEGAATGIASRVAAVVVSRGASARQIAALLAADLDAVFVPRPLVLVPRIPRDALGKVSRTALLELARAR